MPGKRGGKKGRSGSRGRQRISVAEVKRRASQSRQARSRSRSKSGARGRSSSRGRVDKPRKFNSVGRAPKLDKLIKEMDVNQGASPLARDLNIMNPNKCTFQIPTNFSPFFTTGATPLQQIAALIVAQLDSDDSTLFSVTNISNDQHPTPSKLKATLLSLVFAYFKRARIAVDPALVSVLPDYPDDMPVPVPLAKAMQYFAMYKDGDTGVEYILTEISSSLSTVAGATGALSISDNSTNGKGVVAVQVTVPTTIGTGAGGTSTELKITASTSNSSWLDIFRDAPAVMATVAARYNCVDLGKVPLRAPDASASAIVDTSNSGVGHSTNKFDPEVALFLSGNQNALSAVPTTCRKPIPYTVSSSTVRGNLSFSSTITSGNTLIGWVEILRECPWHDGPVKQMIKLYRNGPLNTIIAEVMDADLRNWHMAVAAEIIRCATNSAVAWTDANTWVLATLWESVLYARLGRYAYLMQPNNNRAYQPALKGITLPVWLSIFVWAIGPVVSKGRLRLVLPNQASANGNHWLTWSTAASAYSEVGNKAVEMFQGLFTCADAIVNITLDNRAFDVAGVGAVTNWPMTPVLLMQSFMRLYNAAAGFTADRTGVTTDINKAYGSVPSLAYVTYFQAVGSANIGPKSTFGTHILQRIIYYLDGIASDRQFGKVEVGLIALCGWMPNSAPGGQNVDQTVGLAYEFDIPPSTNLIEMLQATEDGTDFATTMAMVRSKYAKLYSIKGQATDGTAVGAAIFAAIAAIAAPILANVLPTIVRWAADRLGANDSKNTYYSEIGQGINDGYVQSQIQGVKNVNEASEKRYQQLLTLQAALSDPQTKQNLDEYAKYRNGESLTTRVPKSRTGNGATAGGPRRY